MSKNSQITLFKYFENSRLLKRPSLDNLILKINKVKYNYIDYEACANDDALGFVQSVYALISKPEQCLYEQI